MSRRWSALPSIESGTADRLLVLPLREPLAQPTVLRGTGGVIWTLLVRHGDEGVDAEGLADAFAEAGSDHAERQPIVDSIAVFLDELVRLGLARSDAH